jgi:hypothetical protein
MCKGSNFGDAVEVEVFVPADQNHIKMERKAIKKIDKCLAPLVIILNAYGIKTISSCCGHGRRKESYIGLSAENVHLEEIAGSGLASISLKIPYIKNG